MAHPLKVGDTFIQREARPYTLADGTKGTHVRVDRWRVTVTDARGLVAQYDGTITESGRPAFATYPTEKAMAWFGVDAAIARGDLRVGE